MSNFALGDRYSSEDMYRDFPDLKPGGRFIVRDEYTDTIHSVHYRSAEPEIRQHPTGWRRILRNLTPQRWRKPLPVARPSRPAEYEVVPMSDHRRRAELAAERITRTLDRIIPSR